jgi:cytochrome c oxidase subunit II
MPIEVRVVSEQAFAAWIEDAKKKYARDERESPDAIATAALDGNAKTER